MARYPGVTFVPNPLFAAELVRGRFLKEKLEELTEDGAELYRDSVPRDVGDLADSVFADVALTPEGYKGRIGATDWKAGLVEFGTAKTKPDGSLRRAVESLGLEIEEKGR